jgi:hypothetical protein
MDINTVKDLGDSYLVTYSNGVKSDVPKIIKNKDYSKVQEWIADGGIVTPEYTLEEYINLKLEELNDYHFNSSEIREMKINDYFILSLSVEGRDLISEQIHNLDQQIKLNVITEESATFEYFYNGGSIEITLIQLRQLFIFMLNVVNTNYSVYKDHIHTIKNLSTMEEVEAYDFTANYLKNQNLNIE